jgi:hypothetical protein
MALNYIGVQNIISFLETKRCTQRADALILTCSILQSRGKALGRDSLLGLSTLRIPY